MEELKKMVLAVANSISSLRENIEKLRGETEGGFEKQKEETKGVEVRLTKRIDKLGMDLAELSDDAPTIKEFGKLKKRVSRLEKNFAS